MPQYSLSFRIDPHPNKVLPVDLEKQQEFEQRIRLPLYREFGLKVYSYAWVKAIIGLPELSKLLQRMKSLSSSREAVFGSGILDESLTTEEMTNCEWFLVRKPNMNEIFSLKDLYPTCKAFQLLPDQHVIERHFVSDVFRQTVEDSGLTGLKFLWVRDIGKYHAPQWYTAVAQHPLGHGLDHDWFDRTAYEKLHKTPPMFQTGMTHFDIRFFKSSWTTGLPVLDEVLTMFPRECLGLIFQSQQLRYLRKAAPKSNFAYIWNDIDSMVQGRMVRFRELCIDQKAKQTLIDHGILKEKDLLGIRLLDSVPTGLKDLDTIECPPPIFTEKEWLVLKEEESRLYKSFQKVERPRRAPDINRSLKLLKKAKQNSPDQFSKPLPKKKRVSLLEQLPRRLPNQWILVLGVSDGGNWGIGDSAVELESLANLFDFQAECRHQVLLMEPEASDDYFFLGNNDFGDIYALELINEPLSEDCPVVLISHETMDVEKRWDSIADFIESILLGL